MLDIHEMPDSRDLKKLLQEWKLENILPHLYAEKVDVDIFEMMKVSHIRLLLRNYPVGIQIRFEYYLEQWRQDIGKPLKFHIYDDIHQIIIKEQQEKCNEEYSKLFTASNLLGVPKIIQTSSCTNFNSTKSNENDNDASIPTYLSNKSNGSTPLNCTPSTQTVKSQDPVNLKEILLQCQPDGLEIIDCYHKNNKFSQPERRHLINIIVNYYLENDIEFNLQTSNDLENAIMEMFPSEKLNMYRKTKLLYLRYIDARSVFNKPKRVSEKIGNCNNLSDINCDGADNDGSSNGSYSDNDALTHARNSSKLAVSNKENVQNAYSIESVNEPDVTTEIRDLKTTAEDDTEEILLQTLYNDSKKFVKIVQPFLYHDFLSAACAIFNILKMNDHYVTVNDCEIAENDFKNVILQYYKLTTFAVELKERAVHIPQIQLRKMEDLENSCSPLNALVQSNSFMNTSVDNSAVQIIYNHLPDANDIRNIPSLLPMVKMADSGRALENKHRTAIAKAIIDECINFQPERVLKRQDFFTLTQNLVLAFPNEVASAYFIPSQPNHAARGKLWNAYNNKRSFLGSSGIVQRRQNNVKRKHPSDIDDDGETTFDKVFVADTIEENVDFSLTSSLDWDTLKEKWSDCYRKRRDELLKQKMLPHVYMHKYSILKGVHGIALMEIDVNITYPTVANVSNWLSLYEKVIEKARKMRKFQIIPKFIDLIDKSNDEKYRASLALLFISYIFPYNARKHDVSGERASKQEIQQRFIKEYQSMDELKSDIKCADLQIRFVHEHQKITYAEFNLGGFIFKCVDLLEALSSIFHYIMAMNIKYPDMCLHVWQFIQLAIFQIEIEGYILPNVESTINDLCMS